MTLRPRPSADVRRGFTIVELIAVIALIALLLALLIVAFQRASAFANRTTSLGALRQLGTAVNAYAAEHDQALPPGQVSDAELEELRLEAFRGPDRANPVPEEFRNTWVWRLAPYTSDGWSVVMEDDRDADETARLAEDLQSNDTTTVEEALAVIETRPSFGMNSYFVGGDDVQGTELEDNAPWRSFSVTRSDGRTVEEEQIARGTGDVLNPSRLMLFASSVAAADAVQPNFEPSRPLQGGAGLRPPFTQFDDSASDPRDHLWTNRQWESADPEFTRIQASPSASYDLSTRDSAWPVARWGDEAIVPCVHLDGSTSSLPLSEYFYDMRLWAPRAGTQRFGVDEP